MSFCQFSRVGDVSTCTRCGRRVRTKSGSIRAACRAAADYATTNQRLATASSGHGPGTELKRLLAKIGIHAAGDCPCNRHAREMDFLGCDGCEARIEEIVGWLRDEAQRRGLPWIDAAGRLLVRRAISNARRAAPLPPPARPPAALP
jgi:hypothetical protein